MLFLIKALCALTILGFSAQAASGGAVLAVRPESDELIAPNRYIVQFDTAAHLQQAGLAKRGQDPHERFYQHLRDRDVAFDVHVEYKNKGTFVGASVQVSSAGDLSKLASATGVINVFTVSRVSLPQPKVLDVSSKSAAPSNSSKSSLNSRSVASGTYSTYSQLPSIQADLVHRTQNTGAGINIAIVDTGIDYLHASFGSCFRTPGCKVQKGYDFVGDDFTGKNELVPDDDPYSTCNYHGTAVAGLAAGLDNYFDAPGVAPGATIFPYRVFGCSGYTFTDIQLAAMLKAEEDGADVINFSISSNPGWSGSALAVAAANLAKKGIQCVWASGNSGLNGMFYADSAGTDPTVIAAGSVDSAGDNLAVVTFTGSDGSVFDVTTGRFFPFDSGSKSVYYTSSNLCSGFPSDAPVNLANYFVVVSRGECTFANKSAFAAARGAAGIFFVNNVDGINSISGVDDLPYGSISQSDGWKLQGGTSAGVTYTATFPQDLLYVPRPSAGRLTDFSAVGPSYDMYYTTKLTAPGYNILAPFPGNRWTVASGTSFASPITAGAVALYLKAQADRGEKRDLQATRDALFSTAGSVPYGSEGNDESAAAVGSGTVQIFNAISAGTQVTPALITLNDTEFIQATKYIVVSNTDSKTNTYTLSHQPATLMYGLDSTGNKMSDYINIEHDTLSSHAATVKFSRSALTLSPGESAILLLQFTPPSDVDASRLPVYSGQISINGGPVPLKVTYMGAATKMRDTRMISTRKTSYNTSSPALLQGVYTAPATEGQVFKFSATSDTRDFPSVMLNLLTGTRSMVMDLVAADADLGFQPTYTKRELEEVENQVEEDVEVDEEEISTIDIRGDHVDRSGSNLAFDIPRRSAHRAFPAARATATTTDKLNAALKLWCEYTKFQGKGCTAKRGAKTNTFAQVPVLGNIFSWVDVARDDNNIEGDSTNLYTYVRLISPLYSNGSGIPNGNYKFLLRVLRVNGDPTQQADYDSWTSPSFYIAVGE